jgi:hypothetical protein
MTNRQSKYSFEMLADEFDALLGRHQAGAMLAHVIR